MCDDVKNLTNLYLPVDEPELVTLRALEDDWDLSIYHAGRQGFHGFPIEWYEESGSRDMAWWNAPRLTDGKGIDLEP